MVLIKYLKNYKIDIKKYKNIVILEYQYMAYQGRFNRN